MKYFKKELHLDQVDEKTIGLSERSSQQIAPFFRRSFFYPWALSVLIHVGIVCFLFLNTSPKTPSLSAGFKSTTVIRSINGATEVRSDFSMHQKTTPPFRQEPHVQESDAMEIDQIKKESKQPKIQDFEDMHRKKKKTLSDRVKSLNEPKKIDQKISKKPLSEKLKKRKNPDDLSSSKKKSSQDQKEIHSYQALDQQIQASDMEKFKELLKRDAELMKKASQASGSQISSTVTSGTGVGQDAQLESQHVMIEAIRSVWVLPEGTTRNLVCKVRIQLSDTGQVLQVMVEKSSGFILFDQSAIEAIQKASPLPMPSDPKLNRMFRDILLSVRPDDFKSNF